MNNKEFIAELAKRLRISQREAQSKVELFTSHLAETLKDEDLLSVYSFGSFEVVSRKERVALNPGTGKRVLTPPKRVIVFKPGSTLKDRVKNIAVE